MSVIMISPPQKKKERVCCQPCVRRAREGVCGTIEGRGECRQSARAGVGGVSACMRDCVCVCSCVHTRVSTTDNTHKHVFVCTQADASAVDPSHTRLADLVYSQAHTHTHSTVPTLCANLVYGLKHTHTHTRRLMLWRPTPRTPAWLTASTPCGSPSAWSTPSTAS